MCRSCAFQSVGCTGGDGIHCMTCMNLKANLKEVVQNKM